MTTLPTPSPLPHSWVPDTTDPNSFEGRAQENFDSLYQQLKTLFAAHATAIPIVKRGKATGTANSTGDGSVTITHGVGSTPAAVLVTCEHIDAFTTTGAIGVSVASITSTQATLYVTHLTAGEAFTLHWMAVA